MRNNLLSIILILSFSGVQAQYLKHHVHAKINHQLNEISVIDTVVFPSGSNDDASLIFSLNNNLSVELKGKKFKLEKLDNDGDLNSQKYKISTKAKSTGGLKIPIHYSGKLVEKIETGAAEYARGFSVTDGLISSEGIYLAGSTVWIPSFENHDLSTFILNVELDESWNIVSQGTRTVNKAKDGRRIVQYSSSDPVDEIFLIAGEWTEYEVMSGDVLVQVFLRSADEALANKYLGVTSDYLNLYKSLIGEYPYSKFALVENFWETGYGMPSFTLLGEKVIRFPWILHSSYPHELLHNYWGNSVFVDYSQGNWCEGITAYMADHLIKEQQGLADEYRRNTLQKFTDYVNEENDFPPSEFVSRNNPAEEAIGYGKVMMFNNMLRDKFGDNIFVRAYADFYSSNKFKFASFDDIRISFEKITGKDLKPFFDQWIKRKGAPSLELSDVKVLEKENQYQISFSLKQVQKADYFKINVPLVIWTENGEELFMTSVNMDEREIQCSYTLASRPLKVSIDPQYNLMRTLHYSEVPSTLSQLFGAKSAYVLIPKSDKLSPDYRSLAEFWKQTQESQGKEIEILVDADIDHLPSDKPLWVLGFDNAHYKQVRINEEYSDFLSSDAMNKMNSLVNENTLVYAIPGGSISKHTIGFVGTGNSVALTGLARKLFHYGSYGYLGFEGDAPDNVLKGVFPVLGSQLEYVIPYSDSPAIEQRLEGRKALSVYKK
ncbi:M1 family metallopeptidase [Bacteroidota bacterium]